MSGRHAQLFQAACALARATSLSDIGQEALGIVARTMGCSGASIYQVSGDRYSCVSPFGDIAVDTYVERYLADDPVHQVKQRLNPSLAVTTSLVDRRRFERTAVYADFYRPRDWEHTLYIRLCEGPHDERRTTGLTLTRGRGSAWSSRELDLCGQLAPLFRDAARNARSDRDPRATQLGLDLDGTILWCTTAARPLLAEPSVHDAVVAAGRRVGAAYVRRTEERLPRLCVRLADRREPLAIDLVVAMSPAGRPYVLAMLESDVPALPQGFCDHHGLTPAEARVVAELALGQSNRQIALRLAVTENTVRTHMGHVLAKLGVHSRVEALVVLRSWTYRD